MKENLKNLVVNSQITAGGDVHIGDVIYQNTPAQTSKKEDFSPAKIKTQVSNLIGNNQTAEALVLLKNHFSNKNPAAEQEVILLSSRWERNQREARLGKISDETFGIECNRINAALLELLQFLI